MPILFTISRKGNDFFCAADDGEPFFVGRRVPYDGHIGLYNIFAKSPLPKLDYDADDFTQEFGFWARFIEPTARCEGRNFLTLNTYDRAAFTFGFGQFAAHVAEGDFVSYFRRLLALPAAKDYFPHLALQGGHIVQSEAGHVVPLEDAHSTAALMKYLNPDLSEVQDSEVIAAAKFIHWNSHSVPARAAQVAQMTETFHGFMRRADTRVGIDGRPASQCCVIADLLHHGRGGSMLWPAVEAALRSNHPLDELLDIGSLKWKERCRTLGAAIADTPEMATRHWSRTQDGFV
ncbi:hypothetical protein [Ancylobacter lacus]|uniref:hypothetical protein n=1 Tax=Ancylobacter lacus TaxID=2579970 RepID=UPI001BCB2B6E|nr:hypothetical protein [Ancylobacter lacus]MBS7540204.1 hypothetical protein [Ancylobacter lacus]